MKKIYLLFFMMITIGLSYGQLPGVPYDDGNPPDDNTGIIFTNASEPDSPTLTPDYYNYNTNGTNNSFPWNISGGKMVQLLYLAGEFAQPTPAPAGMITDISFRIADSYAIGPWTYTDLTIKLGQSTTTSLTSGSFYTGSLTTVYYSASVSLTGPAGSWMTIHLDAPFTYDPTQSLIVEVGQCGVAGATGYSACRTALSGIRRVWSVGGCPFVAYASGDASVYHVGLTLSIGPTVITTAASSITSTGATLNGQVNANGVSTTVTFEYGPTIAYGSTITAAQSPVTGNTLTNVSGVVTGLVPNTLYHFRAVGVNSGGSANGNDMTFTTAAAPPIVVTGYADPVGTTTATINGTINARNSSTTATFQWGPTPAFGNVAPATPGTVTGNTATAVSANLTGLILSNPYYYRCVGVNSAGTTYGATMMFVAGCPQIIQAGPITGPANVCENYTGIVYSIPPLANTTGYTWSVPPGSTITSGASTPSITVTFGTTSGNISVFGTSSCASGPPTSMAVTVNPIPTPTITGQSSMCVNSGNYTYTTEAGFTNYIWTVSAGGTITWGAGTNQIDINWTTGGAKTITVNYTNAGGCSAPTPTSFNVTVTPLPGAAGNITGTSNVCAGSTGIAYSVSTISNAIAYVWSLPAGAAIASGAGTNAITVDFDANASSGNITVYGNNLCGNGTVSPNYTLVVTNVPEAAGSISGPASVCAGSMGEAFSVAAISGATGYTWTLPAGATIASGTNTENITVDFANNAASGIITVTGTNFCGSGAVSPEFSLAILPIPAAPAITLYGLTLSSNYSDGNQWYYNGAPITNGTAQTQYAEYSGWYWDVVTVDGCESDASNHIFVTITGVDEPANAQFVVYPVPNDGQFTLKVRTLKAETFDITVYNSIGKLIHTNSGIEVNGQNDLIIDLRPVPIGIYTLVIKTEDNRVVRRILVNK